MVVGLPCLGMFTGYAFQQPLSHFYAGRDAELFHFGGGYLTEPLDVGKRFLIIDLAARPCRRASMSAAQQPRALINTN